MLISAWSFPIVKPLRVRRRQAVDRFSSRFNPPSPPQNSSKPISSIFNSIGPQRPPVRLGRRTSNGAHGPVKSLCLTKPPSPDKLEANMFVSLVVVRAGAFVSVSRLLNKKRNVHVL